MKAILNSQLRQNHIETDQIWLLILIFLCLKFFIVGVAQWNILVGIPILRFWISFVQMCMLRAGSACIDHNPHKAIKKTSPDKKHIERLHMKALSILSLTEERSWTTKKKTEKTKQMIIPVLLKKNFKQHVRYSLELTTFLNFWTGFSPSSVSVPDI